MSTPPNSPPPSPPWRSSPAYPVAIPLPPEVRAAYQDLYKKYETAIETTADPGALSALNASQTDVDNILTKDSMYRLNANSDLYDALTKQINTTNQGLVDLKKQITSIASGVSTFGDILSAIDKVLSLVPGV